MAQNNEMIQFLTDEAYNQLKLSNAELLQMVKNIDTINKGFKNAKLPSESVAQAQKAVVELEKTEKAIEKQRLAEIKLQQAREKAFDDYEKKLQREQHQRDKANKQALANAEKEGKAQMRLTQINQEANRPYQLLNENYNRASNALKDLIARGQLAGQTQKQYTAEVQKATKVFQDYHTRITTADHAVRQFQRNVGNYPQLMQTAGNSLRSFLGAFGLVGGIFMFASAIKSAFSSIREFDKANADLAATMGKTRSEIKELTTDAVRLGGSTKFTASEVSSLQKELAKFGFNKKEILDSTEAILNLAAATGEDLATSATVAAQTLRGFGLDASEMGRVTDVMASSFTKSALDLSNFTESMKFVAPVAKSAGVSLELTTAMLAKLADAGVKGSLAGTSLRRILTEMAATGLPAKEAFDKIAKSGITLSDAMDDVGRTAQTSLLILSENKEAVLELDKAFKSAGGSAEKMANEQLQSLDGKLILLSSAWDGFIQSLNKGDGLLSKFFISAIEKVTEFVNVLQRVNETQTEEVERRINDFITETRKNIVGLDADREKAWQSEKQRAGEILKQQEAQLIVAKNLEEQEKQSFGYRVLRNQKEGYLLEQKRIEIEKEIEITKGVQDVINKNISDSYTTREELIKEYVKKVSEVHKNAKKEELLVFAQGRSNERLRKDLEELIMLNKENNKTLKETKKLIEGTAAWYSDLIAKKKKERDETKTSTEAYKKANEEIRLLEQRLEHLKNGLQSVQIVAKAGLQFKTETPDLQAAALALEKYKFALQDIQPLVSSAFDFGDALFEREVSKYDALINKSNEYYDNLLKNAESGSAQEIALLEEKEKAEEALQLKKREAERKQAIARKAFALAEIAINTAVGVTGALSKPATVPLVPFIIAQGALQAATVLAQPIPQYKDGTDYHKGGDAIVGDGGKHEVMVTPDGKQIITPDVPTIIKNMPKGTKVMPDANAFYQSFLLNFKQRNENTNNIEQAIERGFKKAKINNYMNLPKLDLGHQSFKNKGL